MNNLTPVEIFLANIEKEIEKLAKDLEVYAKRPGANQAYLQRRNEEINALVDNFNGLETELQKLVIVTPLAKSIDELMEKDSDMSIITIQLVVNPTKKGNGFIYHNPFS